MGKLKEIENRYYKECSVVILPTGDKTNIGIRNIPHNTKANGLGYSKELLSSKIYWQPLHLYITTDDEIKEGDWFYHINLEKIFKCCEASKTTIWANNKEMGDVAYRCKKIIATTDTSLGYTDKQISPVPNFCTYPQPSQSFIKKYCELGGIDKVLVEHNTFREGERPSAFVTKWNIKTDSHNTITIKSVKDSWSREEVIVFGKKCFDYGVRCESGQIEFEDYGKELNWIKENL